MLADRAMKDRLKEKYKDELVFVVPFDSVKHIEDKFSTSSDGINALKKYDRIGRYIHRYDAEYNPVFQQLIPYVLITNKTGDKYYVSKRIAGEERLLQSLSLGFGGHINAVDGSDSVILNALYREINEEVTIRMIKDSVSFLGNVRDLTSSTSDHLGFVFTVKSTSVKIKEDNVLEGLWMTEDELIKNYFQFEGWSKHIIDYFFDRKKTN